MQSRVRVHELMNYKDKCLGITLWVKRRGELIVRLKAIKYRKDTFRYLSSYLHYSFFWHLVIITFVYCIIKSSSQGQDFWLYWKRLLVSRTSAWIVAPSDCLPALESSKPQFVREEVSGVTVVPLLSLYLSERGPSVPIDKPHLVGIPCWWRMRTSAIGQLLL